MSYTQLGTDLAFNINISSLISYLFFLNLPQMTFFLYFHTLPTLYPNLICVSYVPRDLVVSYTSTKVEQGVVNLEFSNSSDGNGYVMMQACSN